MAKFLPRVLIAAAFLSGCVAIDDFSMFYVPDGAVDSGTDTGTGDSGDTSVDVPDGCVPSPEICNFEDDDCDGAIDEEPTECSVAQGAVACVAGVCALVSCDPGFEGCDGADNCDTALMTDRYHCDTCGGSCGLESDCVDGACLDSRVLWSVIPNSPMTAFLDDVDRNGSRVVVGGIFRQRINVGSVSQAGSTTENRVYVAQLTDAGDVDWVAVSEAGDFNTVHEVAAAPSGDTYVIGEVADFITVGGRTFTTAPSTRSAYLWILDDTGATTGLEDLDSTGQATVTGAGVTGDGTLYITGFFTGTLTFGGAPAVTSAGGTDIFVASRTSGGTTAISSFGTGGNETAFSFAIDDTTSQGLIGGTYSSAITLGSVDLPAPAGGTDYFIASLNPVGGVRWAHAAGGTLGEFSMGVGLDDAGNAYFHTAFPPNADDSGGLTTATFDIAGLEGETVLVGSFDTDGTLRWVRPIGVGAPYYAGFPTASLRYRFGQLSAAGDKVYLWTDVAGGETLDDTSVIGATGSDNAAIIALRGADGALSWAQSFGATRDFDNFAVAAGAGDVVVAGRFREVATIGTMTYTSPSGGFSGFVTRLTSP